MEYDTKHSIPFISIIQAGVTRHETLASSKEHVLRLVELEGEPDYHERIHGKISVEHIGDQWYVALSSEINLSLLYLCWRKALDITFGLLGTACMFLIIPVLALLIYLDSPGPIFYTQERLGSNGQNFRMYKFRSMHLHAEHAGQAIWAAKDDSRVTRVGRFMRATHLDELPQVLNILRGEMSLIGPRPERQEL